MSKELILKLTDFPFQSYDKIRYSDTDRQGHVNNAVFSTYLETGRVEFLYSTGKRVLDDDAELVVASISLQLLGEILWPGKVHIGTGIKRVGNSSISAYQQLFQDDKCVASAETILVQINKTTRKGQALNDATRALLTQHLLPELTD